MNARPTIKPSEAVLDEALAYYRAQRERPKDHAQQAKFRTWIAADLEHAVAADLVVATWNKAELLKKRPIARRLRAEAHARERGRSYGLRSLAASIAVMLIVGAVGFLSMAGPHLHETYATARGERLDVSLADGSKLRINGGTRIDISYDWFARRVELHQGEAEFQVAKDKLRPFTVGAGRLAVRAVGTDFTVRRDGGATSVVLVEGVVVVQPQSADFTPVTLLPASKAVLATNATQLVVQRVDPVVELAWRDGQLMFNRTSLADALQEFARYTGTQVVVQTPEIARLQISGTFRTTDLQSFLDVIGRVHGLRWQRSSDGVYRVERR
jgi:transmembrane sensor